MMTCRLRSVKKLNYDHPDALETDLLVEHLKKLRNGESIECPVYDYSRHNRSDQMIRVEPRRIIVIEGILLLADPRIRDLLDIKIYVEADADERILRRIVRDVKERGRDLAQYRGSVSDHGQTDALPVCGPDACEGGYRHQQRYE